MNGVEEPLREEGVAQLAEALPPALLERHRQTSGALLARVEQMWTEGVRAGLEAPTFFDLTDFSSAPVIAEYVAGVTATLLGERYRDTHRLTQARLRFVAPYPLGYLNWHIDHSDGPNLLLKAMVYLNDIEPGFGEFCYVPRSHVTQGAESDEITARRRGYRRYPGRAGSAVAFDTAGIHAPAANLGAAPRQTLILSFARW